MMVWLAIACLCAVSLAPVAWAMGRGVTVRGRRDPALALHRAQLAELDRDLGEGRIAQADHGSARLEVQRRLLAEAARDEVAPVRASRGPLVAALLLVPGLSVALYLVSAGRPDLPAAPLAARIAASSGRAAEDVKLLAELRESIGRLPPGSDQARQGLLILGQAEATLGHWGPAADAWRQALDIRFDATVAFEVAESTTRAQGHVDAASAELYRKALADGAADAPWHAIATQRLAEAEHH